MSSLLVSFDGRISGCLVSGRLRLQSAHRFDERSRQVSLVSPYAHASPSSVARSPFLGHGDPREALAIVPPLRSWLQR